MKEIIVARNSTGLIKGFAFICLVIVTGRSWPIWWPVRFALLAATFSLAYICVERYSRMKLSVTKDKVHVVNFNSKFSLSLDSVRIDDEVNTKAWPQDDQVQVRDGMMHNAPVDEENAEAEVDLAGDDGVDEEELFRRATADLEGLDFDDAEVIDDVVDHEELIEQSPVPELIPTPQNRREVKKPRSLVLTDASGVRAQVGVAPAYGSRLDEIAEDLYIAIDRMRAIQS